ncbi:hypothetical protein EGW08_011839 [Elysia chlorotica]|uniref:C-type lectin domain-containing protein n=1 Tax=Elysia chlorotica TaxID=188477 RepID=A0A3S1BCM2_ELYCH|nr:hypothetical protein EGW08_011839 [Elysia chlorotica]
MRFVLVLVMMLLLLWSAGTRAGGTFRFRVLDTIHVPSEGHVRCQETGFDGLAIISSPEAYKHAMAVIQPNASSSTSRFAIGLFLNSAERDFFWADGTEYARDTPWSNYPPDTSGTKPFCRLRADGKILTTKDNNAAFSLCGMYDTRESYGRTLHKQQPDGQTSSLRVQQTRSYLECTVLCGSDYRCRAAEYSFTTSMCTTLGPNMFSGFSANEFTSTFDRGSF